MPCQRCSGLVIEAVEVDDEGERWPCLRCCNCGWREYAEPAGKSILVVRGLNYGQRG